MIAFECLILDYHKNINIFFNLGGVSMFSDYFADKTPILSSRILVMSEKKNVGLQGFPASPPDGRDGLGTPDQRIMSPLL